MNHARTDRDATSLNTSIADKVLAEIREDEVIDFHRGIVRIPSVNPPGDVRDAVAYCQAALEREGFAARTVQCDDVKPNLIATLGTNDGPMLCFNAHLDVVPTGEESAWRHAPFGAEVEGGRVYGRGAGDDKASVAAQVMAGIAIARAGVRLRGRLIINEVADEEVGGVDGARFLVEEGHLKPDWVIVGEQTLNRVCVGEKGGAGQTVTVFGRAAHGALPWEGANAIEGAARIIVALKDELGPELETRTHRFFHPSSASVNMIDGGVKGNVVADRCSFYVDRRLVPGETPGGTRAEIEAIATRAIGAVPGLRVEVSSPRMGLGATMVDPDSELVQSMLAANDYLGLNTELTGFSMASDGRFFAAQGIPTIIYGPGDPKLAHIPDEWVGVDEIMSATRAYALAAVGMLGDAG